MIARHLTPLTGPTVAGTPSTLFGSALTCWFDANDATKRTVSGTSVLTWTDTVNSARVVQPGTSTTRPITVANGLASKTVFRFDGLNDLMIATSSFVPTGTFYAAIVAKTDRARPASDKLDIAMGTVAQYANGAAQPGFGMTLGNTYGIPNTPYVGTEGLQGGAMLYKNGWDIEADSTKATMAVGEWVISVMRVGNHPATPRVLHFGTFSNTNRTYWGNVSIAEAVIMTTDTTEARQKLEGYLAWNWGLQANLSTGHPFLTERPTV